MPAGAEKGRAHCDNAVTEAAVPPLQVGRVAGFLHSPTFRFQIRIQKFSSHKFSSLVGLTPCLYTLYTQDSLQIQWLLKWPSWKLPLQAEEWERCGSRWKTLHSTFFWDNSMFWVTLSAFRDQRLNFI